MASIIDDGGGLKRIQFIDRDGNRKTLRLGKATARQSESFKVRLEQLVSAHLYGHPPDDATVKWLGEQSDKVHKRLANTGIVAHRGSTALGAWLDKYLANRVDLKPGSRRKLEQTKAKLIAFFGEAVSLRGITPDQAADWRQGLVTSGLSDAAVKIHAGNAKTFLNEAVRRELLTRNPFAHLASGSTASECDRYVTPEEAEKVIEAMPTTEWKLLFGLARYAGLRIPSESHLLTWADVDFERGRLNVQSPKTERHKGKERRTVPITPKLAKLLQDRFAEAAEGDEHLITIKGKGAVIRAMRRFCKAAGVEAWPRLWQTLRSSCEIEWAATFPQYAVSKWIGHSIVVSGKHYANAVPDDLMQKAAQKAAHIPAQHTSEPGGVMENVK